MPGHVSFIFFINFFMKNVLQCQLFFRIQQRSECGDWRCLFDDVKAQTWWTSLYSGSKTGKQSLINQHRSTESLADIMAIMTLMETGDEKNFNCDGHLMGSNVWINTDGQGAAACGVLVHYCWLFWHIQLCPSWEQALVSQNCWASAERLLGEAADCV